MIISAFPARPFSAGPGRGFRAVPLQLLGSEWNRAVPHNALRREVVQCGLTHISTRAAKNRPTYHWHAAGPPSLPPAPQHGEDLDGGVHGVRDHDGDMHRSQR